jgi:hypothetical protein
MKGLYVYALVPRGVPAAPGVLGVGLTDEALALVDLGAMAAVVGAMEDRPSIAPASLRAHEEVVRRVAAVTDAILPLRFGAMVTSAAELRDGLAPRRDALAAALERTRGCDQMTLRLEADPPPAVLAGVRQALAPLVRAEVVERRPAADTSLFHLVERGRVAEYRARVEALARAIAPRRLAATGPWSPYAFVELG